MIEVRRAGEIPTFDTRADANETVDREKRYQQIVEILSDPTRRGLSAKEVAVEMKKRGFSTTDERNVSAPRLTELSKKGIVEPFGKIVCFYTGKKVSVYRLVKREENNA